MAYPSYPPTPAAAPPPRPTTVTVSSYLLWATAALSVIGAVLSLSTVGALTDAYRELYAGGPAEGTEAVLVGASVVGVVINILFAAGLAILSIFNNRGRQGSRITTWVLGGVLLCCSGFGLLGTAATSSMNLDTTGGAGGPSASEVEARLNEALPGWYTPTSTAITVLTLLTILGAVILLALPASNAFFRKPAGAAWDPSQPYPYPTADPGYPGAPGGGGVPPYPAAPGQPPAGPSPYGPPSGPSPYGPPPGPPASSPPAAPPGSGSPADPPAAPPASGPPSNDPPSNDPWGRPPTDPPR